METKTPGYVYILTNPSRGGGLGIKVRNKKKKMKIFLFLPPKYNIDMMTEEQKQKIIESGKEYFRTIIIPNHLKNMKSSS